jgi:hypothetical protein
LYSNLLIFEPPLGLGRCPVLCSAIAKHLCEQNKFYVLPFGTDWLFNSHSRLSRAKQWEGLVWPAWHTKRALRLKGAEWFCYFPAHRRMDLPRAEKLDFDAVIDIIEISRGRDPGPNHY